jgi:hypothetical protein
VVTRLFSCGNPGQYLRKRIFMAHTFSTLNLTFGHMNILQQLKLFQYLRTSGNTAALRPWNGSLMARFLVG